MSKVTQPIAVKSGFEPRPLGSRTRAQVSNIMSGGDKTGDGKQHNMVMVEWLGKSLLRK